MSLARLFALIPYALSLLVGLRAARGDDDPEIAVFKARAGNMTATAISNDGKYVLTGEDDGLVTLWDVKRPGTPARNFMGHFPKEVFAAALLPDGKRGVTCGDDNAVVVWDLATGQRLRQMSTGDSVPLVISCNPEGALAATGCDDGRIFIWNVATGRCLAMLRHAAPICGILFSPDGRLLAAGYSDGHVLLWDTARWTAKITLPDAERASVGALAFSPDGRLLATGNQNGAGFVWNTSDGSQASAFAGYEHPEAAPAPPVAPVFPGSVITPDNRSAILFLSFSRDAGSLLGSIQDAAPRFWETKTGRFLGTADWFQDNRFYIARYGYPFATAAITPKRDFIVLMKENLAEVWRCPWTPNPPPAQ